jgi:hypothetical protein
VVDIAGVLRESVRISDERFTRLDDRLTRLDSIVRELVEAGKATDERLNALIQVVDRHITGPDHRPPAQ